MTILTPEFWSRDANFRRKHRIDVYDKATLILRDLTTGSWLIEGVPYDHPAAADLEPGGGIIAYYNDVVLTSGRVEKAEDIGVVDDSGTQLRHNAGGSDDKAYIGDRLCHPHPADLDFTASVADSRGGASSPAETVIKQYVDYNLNGNAAASRKQAGVTIAADQGRGSFVSEATRLDNLLDVVAALCIRGGVLPSCKALNGAITFDVYLSNDYSKKCVFALGRRNCVKIQRTELAPTMNFEWVGGQGVGTARTFISQQDTVSQDRWGFRRESFHDRRDTNDNTVLNQTATSDLGAGSAQLAVAVTPIDGAAGFRFMTDYSLGDYCSVILPNGQKYLKVVREVQIECSADVVTKFTPILADPITPAPGTPAFLQFIADMAQPTAADVQ